MVFLFAILLIKGDKWNTKDWWRQSRQPEIERRLCLFPYLSSSIEISFKSPNPALESTVHEMRNDFHFLLHSPLKQVHLLHDESHYRGSFSIEITTYLPVQPNHCNECDGGGLPLLPFIVVIYSPTGWDTKYAYQWSPSVLLQEESNDASGSPHLPYGNHPPISHADAKEIEIST